MYCVELSKFTITDRKGDKNAILGILRNKILNKAIPVTTRKSLVGIIESDAPLHIKQGVVTYLAKLFPEPVEAIMPLRLKTVIALIFTKLHKMDLSEALARPDYMYAMYSTIAKLVNTPALALSRAAVFGPELIMMKWRKTTNYFLDKFLFDKAQRHRRVTTITPIHPRDQIINFIVDMKEWILLTIKNIDSKNEKRRRQNRRRKRSHRPPKHVLV